jgi:molybdate transport system substrate-binding protein
MYAAMRDRAMKSFHQMRLALFAAALAVMPPSALAAASSDRITVFAAASLANTLQDIGKTYEAKTGRKLVFSFAASSLLAKQIESGGGAEMFFSADTEWMDYLDKRGLLAPGTRHNLLGNRLVLIEPANLNTPMIIGKNFPLAKALGIGRLALADPDTVPAGKYARAALISLGVWDSVASHLAPAENVRVALAYVARGEAPFGIVYETDARIEPKVRIVDTFPEATHPPIVYPVALTKDAKPEAKAFLDYLNGSEARAIFVKYGFGILTKQ